MATTKSKAMQRYKTYKARRKNGHKPKARMVFADVKKENINPELTYTKSRMVFADVKEHDKENANLIPEFQEDHGMTRSRGGR